MVIRILIILSLALQSVTAWSNCSGLVCKDDCGCVRAMMDTHGCCSKVPGTVPLDWGDEVPESPCFCGGTYASWVASLNSENSRVNFPFPGSLGSVLRLPSLEGQPVALFNEHLPPVDKRRRATLSVWLI